MKHKKIIFIIFLCAFVSRAAAQWDPEYDFFTLKGGFNHSLFDKQPNKFSQRLMESPYGNLEMKPSDGYAGYTLGYHAGILFTHDMKNNLTGVSFGVEYQTFGMSQKFETVDKLKYTLTEHQLINTVAIPFVVKIGKNMYKNQRYLYAGLQYNYNLGMVITQEVTWNPNVSKVKAEPETFARKNWVGVLGFNYMIFNIEANYVFGGFLNKDYEVKMEYYGNPSVRPYASYPNGLFFIKTSMTLPINPWSTNNYYQLKRKLRRWLK